MKVLVAAFAICVIASIGPGIARAQHLHQHGNHFDVHQNVPHGHDAAGHLTDGFGHHIDGDGRHTGAIGVYENGAYDRGWNSHPSYYGTPTYISPSYSVPAYASPSYYYSAPNAYLTPNYSTPNFPQGSSVVTSPPPATVGGTTVVNKIPVPNVNQIPGIGSQLGGSTVLRNPRESGGAISYSLNNYSYTIKPGEIQRLQADRNWIIKFDNGLGRSITYRLESGNYEFTVSPQTGWDVGRSIEAQSPVPRANVPPNLLQNTIPKSSLGSAPPPVTIDN